MFNSYIELPEGKLASVGYIGLAHLEILDRELAGDKIWVGLKMGHTGIPQNSPVETGP